MWNFENILVTGGAGVIGTHLIQRLIKKGAKVTCLDVSPRPQHIPKIVEYHRKDLSKISAEELSMFNPDVIFHLAAAFERTKETPEFFSENFKNNVLLTHKIIDFAEGCKNLEKFIFASSYLVYSPEMYLYATPKRQPRRLKETDPVNPRNLCGAAKYYAEKELEFLGEVSNDEFTYVSTRIFRVYGCRSRDVISRWVRMALREDRLSVFQKENMFDYVYAEDVAEALVRISEKVKKNNIVNVGMGVSTKVSEVLSIIRKMVPDTRTRETSVEGAFEASCADISRLVQLTGWRPRISIEEGIERIVDHEKKNMNIT